VAQARVSRVMFPSVRAGPGFGDFLGLRGKTYLPCNAEGPCPSEVKVFFIGYLTNASKVSFSTGPVWMQGFVSVLKQKILRFHKANTLALENCGVWFGSNNSCTPKTKALLNLSLFRLQKLRSGPLFLNHGFTRLWFLKLPLANTLVWTKHNKIQTG
jgi:hypothetical protein